MPESKEWGIYVYYAADVSSRTMQDAAWRSLQSLASAGSRPGIGITAMIDLPSRDTAYYVMPEQPPGQATWSVYPDRFLPNVNSASIATIADFLEWSSANCPAQKVALVFWGHGYALDDYDPTGPQRGASDTGVNRGRRPVQQRAATGFPGNGGNELKLLYDSTHDAVLNNRDFGNVLRSFNVSAGPEKRIQILGLDCCNMALAEVLSELQYYADIVIAAESTLPFRSWLSQNVLEHFLDHREVTPEAFSKAAVELFVKSYEPSEDPYLELSVCDLRQCPALEEAMKKLSGELIAAIDAPENRAAIDRAWLRDVSFLVDGFIDLGTFCKFLQEEMKWNTAVCEAADGVARTAGQVVLYCGVAPKDGNKKISLATGLTIWFPSWIRFPSVRYPQIDQSKAYLFNGYPQTHFAQVTDWDRFLTKLFFLTHGNSF